MTLSKEQLCPLPLLISGLSQVQCEVRNPESVPAPSYHSMPKASFLCPLMFSREMIVVAPNVSCLGYLRT